MPAEISEERIGGQSWSCDDRDASGACRNPHGCHCAEIASLTAALTAAQDRSAGLEADLAESRDREVSARADYEATEARAQAAEAASAAMAPFFAKVPDPSWPDDAALVVEGRIGGEPTGLTVGDFRRIRAALNPEGGAK